MSQGSAQEPLSRITAQLLKVFENEDSWNESLRPLGIEKEHRIRITTEGALIGSLVENDFNTNMVILSGDAAQFNVLSHAFCRIHAERLINKLIGLAGEQKQAVKSIQSELWDLYASLKEFKENPEQQKKPASRLDSMKFSRRHVLPP